jgi:sugar diacid utilization regulator
VRLDELLRREPSLGLTLVGGPWDARAVEHVVIVDDLAELSRAPRGAIAILTRHASALAAGYQLDLLLRRAGEAQLAAIATYGPPSTSATAIRLADRTRVGLLAVAPARDLSEVAFELERNIRSGADAMLRRIVATLAVIEHTEQAGVDAILLAASEALGAEVRLGEPGEAPTRVPVMVDGRRHGYVFAEAADAAAGIGCRMVADAVARVRGAERSSQEGRARARAEVLSDALNVPADRLADVINRARSIDMPLEGRHTVIALEVDNAGELVGALLTGDVEEVLLTLAHGAAEAVEPRWHAARIDAAIVLVRMQRRTPAGSAAASPTGVAEAVIGRLVTQFPEIRVFCGVSDEHDAPAGLKTAAGEARSALANARAAGRSNAPVRFQDSTLRRVLVELLSSDPARASVNELLAPLDRLGHRRARTAVRTLQVYLDERGSLVRAGRALHLHPNAVAYRIKGIRAKLDVDLDDADQRLALQLACRARLLTGPGP